VTEAAEDNAWRPLRSGIYTEITVPLWTCSKSFSEIDSDDTLVFLGDYIDRGPDFKSCIEQIVRIAREAPFSVVTLRGNHEEWMLATMDDYTRHSWLLGAEAFETVRSYSASAAEKLRLAVDEAGPRLITDDIELPYEAFFEMMPDEHKHFFRSLRLCHKSDGAIFVHAGLDPKGGAPEEQNSRELTWGLVHDFPDGYQGADKIVYGHRNNFILDSNEWPQPHIVNELTYGIDSISTGILTAIRMPDRKVFQSKRFL
jgi:serine/threonine protein phosphatase 1